MPSPASTSATRRVAVGCDSGFVSAGPSSKAPPSSIPEATVRRHVVVVSPWIGSPRLHPSGGEVYPIVHDVARGVPLRLAAKRHKVPLEAVVVACLFSAEWDPDHVLRDPENAWLAWASQARPLLLAGKVEEISQPPLALHPAEQEAVSHPSATL